MIALVLNNVPVIIYDGPNACPKCNGWKYVADTDDQESWQDWAQLVAPADIAIRLGLVKPITCPRCKGTGKSETSA